MRVIDDDDTFLASAPVHQLAAVIITVDAAWNF